MSILDTYKDIDRKIERGIEENNIKVSCKKGCSACCSLMCTITIPEANLLAEKVCQHWDWRGLMRKLTEVAKVSKEIFDQREWFRKGIPCPLLKDDLCLFYEERPSSCRCHLVISPPEDCRRENEEGTLALNLISFEMSVWALSEAPLMAPLSIMVLEAISQLRGATPEQVKLAAKSLGGVSLETWMDGYFSSPAAKLDYEAEKTFLPRGAG